MKIASLILLLVIGMLKCASKDHGDNHHGHAQAGHADNDPHDHPHKHIQGNKPNQAKNGKLRVLRKKKKLPVFNVRNSEESGWEVYMILILLMLVLKIQMRSW